MSSQCVSSRALVMALGLVPVLGAVSAPAMAQSDRITLPAEPLDQALERIRTQTGARISFDPDAVRGLTSAPVVDARGAMAAVKQATHGMRLAVTHATDGSILVVNDIVVIAHRDEAETNVMVRSGTTSTRTGVSLRDQPRNVQVISSKLLAEQQAQTIPDALRNAGGVTVNTATIQGGVAYTVRGMYSGGAVNGLPANSSTTFAAGGTQPVANVERLEVLKGPDAILLGGDSLGGTVNIVTKKPSADERLYVSGETGSFGAVRGTVDVNRALTNDGTVSARIIATAATADHNFGGYRGNEDYLFAPSLRYKNGGTDIILSISSANQLSGMVPFTFYDTTSRQPIDRPTGIPLIGGENQFIQIRNTIYDAQVKQDVSSWITIVGHWQHQSSAMHIQQYSPFAVLAPNLLLINSSGTRQDNLNNAVDGYVRATFNTGGVRHKFIAGGMASNYDTDGYSTDGGGFGLYDYVTHTPALKPLPTSYYRYSNATGYQKSYYAQYYAKYWKFALLASVRKTESLYIGRTNPAASPKRYQSNGALTPTIGVVVAVTDDLSVYGTLAYGFSPSFVTDRFLNLLPDMRSRNAETGFKWDLFDRKILVNGSWFRLSQSNYKVPDPLDTRYYINLPAQLAQGIDVSISGEPLKGLLLNGSFTRTEYTLLTPNNPALGNTVQLQPRDQYNVYGSYRHRMAENVTAGLGLGVYGRSSAAIDRKGLYWIGPSNQVDTNAFLTIGRLDLNFGIRNLFNRVNYGPTTTTTYVPIGETRTWRLTAGYRFR